VQLAIVWLPPGSALYYDAEGRLEPGAKMLNTGEGESEARGTTETARTAPGSNAGFLWDFWYPAARSDEIYGHHLATATLLEVPLVVGRTSAGKAFAMRDACPHRGIPLSYGHFDGTNLECSYHGWEFDACSGRCVEIPSLVNKDKLKVERIAAGHYPCEERDGYVWVYMNAPGTLLPETIPPAPELPKFSERYKVARLDCELPSHVDQGIIGLMDPAHGPFVHQSWFWRSKRSMHEKAKQFEPIPGGFRMSKHAPSANSAPYQLLRKMTVSRLPPRSISCCRICGLRRSAAASCGFRAGLR
jgi:phenylpropionate dioxygenase-like ring-hydroxylating dioxygenase large terminal subunit